MPPEAANKLGVYVIGMGAVASTLFAGVKIACKDGRPPIGSLTQMGWAPGAGKPRLLREALPLAPLSRLEFGGADLIERNACAAARTAGVLNADDIHRVSRELTAIRADRGLHDPAYIGDLRATHARPASGKSAQAAAMVRAYRRFFKARGCSRGVVALTLSTEAWQPFTEVHATPEAFRKGLRRNDPAISPSQIYAWAAIEAGYPVANCTPNAVVDMPALQALALERGVPIAGADLKSGQTYMKTVIASGLAQRLLGVRGWYSTNILGNRDGLVLRQPENFKAKEITKGGVLTDILDAKAQPELYSKIEHQIHINYFPPKGDNKESWDAVQLFGWLGYEMELKINFQCRDSILAAPLVLDILLLLDLAARRGERGPQSWLASYFKHPVFAAGETLTNDPHRQMALLQEKIATWM